MTIRTKNNPNDSNGLNCKKKSLHNTIKFRETIQKNVLA